MGGLCLNEILAMEAQAGVGHSHKAIINVFLPGGPPHIDMWDLKPDAPPRSAASSSRSRPTCRASRSASCFPKLAAMMDKFVIIRSLVDSDGDHDAYQCMTGRKSERPPPTAAGRRSGRGSRRLQGPATRRAANVALMYTTGNRTWGDPGDGGFLGMAHAPFNARRPQGPRDKTDNMVLQGITLDRLQIAMQLRASRSTASAAMPTPRHDGRHGRLQHAAGPGHSHRSKLADALDLSKEDPRIVGALRQERRRRSSATAPADGRELLHRPPAGRSRRPRS